MAIKKMTVDTSDSASGALRTLLASIHPARVAGVSHQIRAHQNGWVPDFDGLDVRKARTLIDAHPDRIAAATALSMHRDGHIRQRGVQAMSGVTDPLVVPFLLLRCGEWSGAVRQDAISAIDPWIHLDHAAVLVRSFPLLSGARFAPFRPARDLPHLIEEILRSPAARPALLAAVTDHDLITARTAIRLTVADCPTIDLLERALTTGDVVSAALVARSLPTEGPLNQQTGNLVWQHPAARLRQEGVYRLLKHGDTQAESIATAALKDRSELVRSTAQRWLRDRGKDTADLYRSMSHDDPLASLLGLGDYPDERDAAFARASLEERPRIRRAALRLLGKLGLRGDQQLFVDAFMSGSARERRTAIAWFRRTGVTPEIINAMWSQTQPGGEGKDSKVRVLRQLAPMTSVWHQIEFALRAFNTQNSMVENAGAVLLLRIAYKPRGFRSRPDVEHLDRLRSMFESARPAIDAHLFGRYRRPDLSHRIDRLLHA